MRKRNYKRMTLLVVILSLLLTLSPLTGMAALGGNSTTDSSVELPTTGFEDREGDGWTTLTEEAAFLEELADKSERVTYSQAGWSVEGHPIHLVRVGYPAPPSDADIAAGRNILIMGTPHGNEPAGREMTLKLMRDLAFTEDPELLEQMSDATILFVPTPNPDGRKANTRGNAWGADNNRDHLNLNTPEGQTVAKIMNQFRPDITVDAHERPSGSNPDIEFLWPRNLNVDDELRDLNTEMVQDYVRPDVEAAGFSTGLYGSPGGSGSGDERILRNTSGLRHGLGLLTESAGRETPTARVDMQMHAAESVLRFYRERFDDIETVVTEAPQRKQAAGANQEAFYLEGTHGWDPSEYPPIELDPVPCGYLLHTEQAEAISRHIELFSIETEQVSENGVFVTMDQPMMTVVPLLLDERAQYNEVDGLALPDCSDPGKVEPPTLPEQTEPAQYETDFAKDEVGGAPEGWSTLWRDSGWIVLDAPRRLEHRVIGAGNGRRALTLDEVGDVRGDVEVSGVVRASGVKNTMLQIGFHMSGEAGSENGYYLDMRSPDASSSANRVRINRYQDGEYTLLRSAPLPFTVEEDTWYHVVLKREGNVLWAKVWPFGEDEPAFQVMTVDSTFDHGLVGVGHFDSSVVNDWAFIGVGTGGEPAPRAPEDLLSGVDKSFLQDRVEDIHTMSPNETNYTEDSWQAFSEALAAAESVLDNPEATQSDVDTALASLNEAYAGLEIMPAQYKTNFAKYEAGEPPFDWTPFWQESSWTVLDEPSRLEHVVTPGGERRALTWNEVGEIRGDTEVSGLVRASGTGTTMLQLALNVSGVSGSESSYYLDLRTTDYVRLNRLLNGSYTTLKSVELPFTVANDTWYQVVLQRKGDTLRGKVWPFGEEEPAEWQVEVTDDAIDRGRVGVSHVSSGRVNEWAFFGVGIGGESAPRAPEDLFDPEVDKAALKNRVNEIHAENLREEDYTEDSWEALQNALVKAESVLNDPEATQSEVDAALADLNEARAGLEEKDTPPVSAESMKTRVERFAGEGAFANDQAVRSLTIHLTAVSHYEGKAQSEKVLKHMQSFKQLLRHQKANDWISEEAYDVLKADADSLIARWQS